MLLMKVCVTDMKKQVFTSFSRCKFHTCNTMHEDYASWSLTFPYATRYCVPSYIQQSAGFIRNHILLLFNQKLCSNPFEKDWTWIHWKSLENIQNSSEQTLCTGSIEGYMEIQGFERIAVPVPVKTCKMSSTFRINQDIVPEDFKVTF